MLTFPAPLEPGDTIAVTAPSAGVGRQEAERIDFCIDWLRSAEVDEQTSRTASMAATRASSAGRSSAFGQSVRCTERPPVSPRQISSVVSGSSGAVTRATTSSAV